MFGTHNKDGSGWVGGRGPKHLISIRILHSGSKAKTSGIPETIVCRLARAFAGFTRYFPPTLCQD